MSAHPLAKQVSRFFKGVFALPEGRKGSKQFIICPVSSGIDSTAVAIVMSVLYPDLPITYVHTDTGIEVTGTEDAINRIERFTGKRVIRIKPPMGLLDIIEHQGNYLPSPRQRFCTQVAKIKPFKQFLKALEQKYPDSEFVSLVGIRADEPSREGVIWGEDNIKTVFPLRELGLDKTAVNRIVQECIGLPVYYAARTRSGCFTCFFQKRSEVIGVLRIEEDRMDQAAKTENLPEAYKSILERMPQSVSAKLGVGRNYLKMAMPKEIGTKMPWHNERGMARRKSEQADLFSAGNKVFYVAVEHHINEMDGHKTVHYQNLVNYSGSIGGLMTSVKNHWLHRGNTKEIFSIDSETTLRKEIQIGIYVVEMFNAEEELPGTPEGVYTWQSDRQSILLIKKTSYMLEQILLEEGLMQDAKGGDVWAQKKLFALQGRTGAILHASLFDAPTLCSLIADIDTEDGPVMCNACSR
jgi:3'-phosphoadenosine 5'-phosphosulfate sulfotransferase (PAPS reductase)/FAD synthetase